MRCISNQLFLSPIFLWLHHQASAEVHLGYFLTRTSYGSSSHWKLCLWSRWINSEAYLEMNGWPNSLQEIGIGLIGFSLTISTWYLDSRYLRWSFVAWYSNPVSNQTYIHLWPTSSFVHKSNTSSLSDPPLILTRILLYFGLLIISSAFFYAINDDTRTATAYPYQFFTWFRIIMLVLCI